MFFCNIIVVIKFANGHNSFSAAIRKSREKVLSHFRNHHLQVIIAQIAVAPTPRPSLKHALKQHSQFSQCLFLVLWSTLYSRMRMVAVTLWDGPSHKFIHMRLLYTRFNLTFCTGVSVQKHNLRTLQHLQELLHIVHIQRKHLQCIGILMHWGFRSVRSVGRGGRWVWGRGCATHSLGFLLIPESIAGLPPICLLPCNMSCGKRCEVSEEIS